MTLVLVDVADGIGVVTLNEPERRNPMSPALIAELTRALEDLAADDACRTVVLRGAGRGFCAGADMSRMAVTSVAEDREEYDAIVALNHLVWGYVKPTVAAVHGFALGGGCSLMNWCDFAIVEESTRMGFPEVAVGLPSTTVVPTLLRCVGRKATLEFILLGRGISPARAEQTGLIFQRVPEGEAFETAMDLARTLASHDPDAVRQTKEIVRMVSELPYEPSIAYAKDARVLARATAQAAEAG
jgi:enoyl-CoA hydratase/carnithine racemase